jgi:hypothetical protein
MCIKLLKLRLRQGRIFLTSFLSREDAYKGIISRMKVLGHAMETLSPPPLDVQTEMLLHSSDSPNGIARNASSAHRRSLSLGGSIDFSARCDAHSAVSDADMCDVIPTAATTVCTPELRLSAESGGPPAAAALETADTATTSPFAARLARHESLLTEALCDNLQLPALPSNHVAPLVGMQLPVSVQEFFLCFVSDDHEFNTKVTTQFLCLLPPLV